jgi:hypothetical protein
LPDGDIEVALRKPTVKNSTFGMPSCCASLLHEIGHLQLIDESRRSGRLKFAREKLAQQFALLWCNRLWSVPFHHIDPVHNAPAPEELHSLSPNGSQ